MIPRTAMGLVLVLGSIAAFTGCTAGSPAVPAPDSRAATSADQKTTLDPEVEKALAQLPSDDRAQAERQATCPVSGEPLGSMGKPVKMAIEGREVFICCAGCEDIVREDPDKYLRQIAAE